MTVDGVSLFFMFLWIIFIIQMLHIIGTQAFQEEELSAIDGMKSKNNYKSLSSVVQEENFMKVYPNFGDGLSREKIFTTKAKNLRFESLEVFNWSNYKMSFKKKYPNVRDELVRKIVFIANSLKIFVNNVAFSLGLRSYYLAVNQFTDYEPLEINGLFKFRGIQGELRLTGNNNGQESAVNLKESASAIEEVVLAPRSAIEGSEVELEHFIGKKQPGHGIFAGKLKIERAPNLTRQRRSSSDLISHSDGDSSCLDSVVVEKSDKNADIVDGLGLKQSPFIDLRETGCLTVPRHQGTCGSCYAFSVVSLMEYFHCMKTDKLVQFSEQYMVDCGHYTNLDGCIGGSMVNVARFIMDWGLELQANYPYMSKLSDCPYKEDEWEKAGYMRPHLRRFRFVEKRSEWPNILANVGPMLIAIRPPADILLYGGKVHSGDNCQRDIGHAVLLVGHGIEDGQEYWLIKNTLGYSWGEAGYFKLSKNANELCFKDAVETIIDFTSKPQLPKVIEENIYGKRIERKVRPSEAFPSYLNPIFQTLEFR